MSSVTHSWQDFPWGSQMVDAVTRRSLAVQEGTRLAANCPTGLRRYRRGITADGLAVQEQPAILRASDTLTDPPAQPPKMSRHWLRVLLAPRRFLWPCGRETLPCASPAPVVSITRAARDGILRGTSLASRIQAPIAPAHTKTRDKPLSCDEIIGRAASGSLCPLYELASRALSVKRSRRFIMGPHIPAGISPTRGPGSNTTIAS